MALFPPSHLNRSHPKKNRFTLSLAFLALTTPAIAEGPQDAVDALIAAMASGDAYSVDGDLTRGDGFDTWITSDITGPGAQFRMENATVTDNTVDALVMWGRGGTLASPARYVFNVEDGKIDGWRMVSR